MTVKQTTINQAKYDKDHTVRYALKLNTTTDKDIIEKIDSTAKTLQLSKQGAIKHLIRKNED